MTLDYIDPEGVEFKYRIVNVNIVVDDLSGCEYIEALVAECDLNSV